MTDPTWLPDLTGSTGPQYVALAEAIAADIAAGRLTPGDRLPPQRRVAQALGVDVSAISRGYTEAARRGYVEAHVGRGTFVRDPKADELRPDPRRTAQEDARMIMPPEPDDPALIARMQGGLAHVSANIVPLLRYQSATGSGKDHEVARDWMHSNGLRFESDLFAVAPGANAAIEAALRVSCRPGTVVLCESVTYLGVRAVAASLNLTLIGLPEDAHGIVPAALEQAIETHGDVILYLNPTLRNPTTQTMPAHRREDIANILDWHGVLLIEDDAYRFVATQTPEPIAARVPHLVWHVAGISKVFGAGLRLAYTHAPNRALLSAFVQAVRTNQVMASPVSLALLSTWIEDGTAGEIQAFVRRAAQARQRIAAEVLAGQSFCTDMDAYILWLTLPEGQSRADIVARMARRPIGILPSDVFTVAGPASNALRVCLGGPIGEDGLHQALSELRDALMQPNWLA